MQPIIESNPCSEVRTELSTLPASSSEIFLEKIPESKNSSVGKLPSGCLYKYLDNKKLKDGRIISYPRINGSRDHNNPNHWRWGYNWKEKIDGEWKNHCISIPKNLVCIVKSMIDSNTPSMVIRNFVQGKKCSKNS